MATPTVAVIGSGFGGSVMACRLAETGRYTVVVLERGRKYGRNEFPRRPDEMRANFWDPEDGYYGLFEYNSFPGTDVEVWTASGLGGGSLIYANVLYEMPAAMFSGWPGGITRARLDPYYTRVLSTMEARPYPVDQPGWPYADTPKTHALTRAYKSLRRDDEPHPAATLEWPNLAIQFGPEPGAEIVNQHDVRQSACTMCGECVVGCNYHAKNTLDLNYLARARQFGALVRTEAEVSSVVPNGRGYRVTYGHPRYPERAETVDADYVVFAAGSLGTPRLLLRMKRSGALPHLGPALGTRWCGNGDLLGMSFDTDEPVYPSKGPTITGAIRFMHSGYPDGFPHTLYVEDAGIPSFMAWYLTGVTPAWHSVLRGAVALARLVRGIVLGRREINVGDEVGSLLFHESDTVARTMSFLGMGRDRSDGKLELDRKGRLLLRWDSRASRLHFERLREAMNRLSTALGGRFVENPISLLTRYIAVHPLGGCPMGERAETAVVNAATGESFGHRGLYIVDSSIIPTSIGPNPSLTIAALAEMFAESFP